MSFLGLRPSDAPALTEAATGETTSYRELLRQAGAIRAQMGEGKRLICLLTRNDPFSALVFAAGQIHGDAVALLDGSRTVAEQATILSSYAPDVVAGPPGTSGALRELGLTIRREVPAQGGELVELGWPAVADLEPDLALLLTTSGTTGSRKFVRLSARNIEANARSIARCLDLDHAERPITSLPLHYSFGLSILNSHWFTGASVVLSSDSVVQPTFWEAVRELECTSLAGVPYSYQLLERIGFRDMDLPSISSLQQAGGALGRTLAATYDQHMRSRGGRFFVMYGQTEATARMTYVPPERLAAKLGSAGIAIPGGRIDIEHSTEAGGQPGAGKVIYRGPNVMLGYAHSRADLASGDELGGVLNTGDVGYLDDDGYLYLTGRSSRIAKVFGQRVNLDEVELVLREQGPAAVVAGDDRIVGFCAFGTEASMARARSALARRLRLHHSAIQLRYVTQIPVTSSGKVDYRRLASLTEEA